MSFKSTFGFKKGFASIYALVIALSISLVVISSLHISYQRKEDALALHIHSQSKLYISSLKDMALLCLRKYDLNTCATNTLSLSPHFTGSYFVNRLDSKSLLLDIVIESKSPLSTHNLRTIKRFILKDEDGKLTT
ncbi:hypothetical protein BKH43_04220 [Helicobacter sp. 13S00401-1]|uniref:hypothetical protein n=1 Tax=Helicobacter sp. 13S00401-1 TaxID=1905758 RepID=UPI000BA6271C|nr:hypothetical protein [Helicobacter sp. 13S00401-1]PAF50769.1 hypothetical protein BKH43_04220 [Helicobacter sp. 13S00401-1]